MAKKALKIIKKVKRKIIEPFVPETIVQEPVNVVIEKKPTDCVVVGCNDPIAPGQTHVCVRHQRSN